MCTHSCPFSWLVFCEAVGVMILERYEGAVFRTSLALANLQDVGDHEHFPVHDCNGNSLVFSLSHVSSFCLFHLFYPPLSYANLSAECGSWSLNRGTLGRKHASKGI